MMGIVMPETCWAYKKYNKIISGIQFVFYSSLPNWLVLTDAGRNASRQEYSRTKQSYQMSVRRNTTRYTADYELGKINRDTSTGNRGVQQMRASRRSSPVHVTDAWQVDPIFTLRCSKFSPHRRQWYSVPVHNEQKCLPLRTLTSVYFDMG